MIFEDELNTSAPSAPKIIAVLDVALAMSRPVPKFARIAPEVADSCKRLVLSMAYEAVRAVVKVKSMSPPPLAINLCQ